MDLLEVVRNLVAALPDGPHQVGLKSVLRHIDAAYRHLSRGQREGDDSAYSDAIYRCNQAFEGSIKEAYRILAEKDPQKTTPYSIEKYLQQNNLFRSRVLSQFTNYRTEWRNPSTHDYNLDFDENEAFLAIVSVSAFTKMLIDQISERLAFVYVRDDLATGLTDRDRTVPNFHGLLDEATEILLTFFRDYLHSMRPLDVSSEALLMGALSAYISSSDHSLHVFTNEVGRNNLGVDIQLVRGDENVLIELKRGKSSMALENGVRQLEVMLLRDNVTSGILVVYAFEKTEYIVSNIERSGGLKIRVIAPG